MVSTEVVFGNSAVVGTFSELVFTFAEFCAISLNSVGKILRNIAESKQIPTWNSGRKTGTGITLYRIRTWAWEWAWQGGMGMARGAWARKADMGMDIMGWHAHGHGNNMYIYM
jgi:hypothetical protein